MTRRARRWLTGTALALATAGVFSCLPGYHLVRTWLADKNELVPPAPGRVDDASRLNETAVAEVRDIPADPDRAEEQLRELLFRANAHGLTVAIAGARHTMGGHTIAPDGIILNMLPFNRMSFDEAARTLHVGAGARWADVVPFLDVRGCSVEVMQSNNNFSVGGSLSANCHGWQHNHAPIASTVRAFRLMKADGTVVRCSRDENRELFGLVLGGYGLFGVILDVELRVVPNDRYRLESTVVSSNRYVATFREKVDGADDVGMVYGRLCVVPGEPFLRESILNVFRKAPCRPEEIPALTGPALPGLRRTVFLGQVGSDYGKRLRWNAEKQLGADALQKYCSRNQLLNEAAELFQEHLAARTDILHEYFIPAGHFEDFLRRLRVLIPRHGGDLLNVTVRNVRRDEDAYLRYADQEMFGFVLLFSQERTSAADARMAAMTQEMIDAALELGGRYYLPYRLHASREQFEQAYPQARRFFELKRQYDPNGIFQNLFYQKYGRPQAP
jgi:FAD/FMN-containing dehydrogenase